MWHPSAKVLSLLTVTLSAMYLGSYLYRIADPQKREAKHPFWHSVRAIANPLEDDWELPSLRTASILLASIGMVVFAILVGMVTESVESAVRSADGERSTVVVKDHILVCGWNGHVTQILSDVRGLSKRTRVVVLADSDQKEDMMSGIRAGLNDEQRKGLRVYYRPGAPIVEEDLRRVAADRARKIILVNPRAKSAVDSDRLVLSRALALRQHLPAFTGDIVAELSSSRDESILKSVLKNTSARSVETINVERLLFRFMAQAIRQPGLADVVAQLMSSDKRTVFHVREAKDVAPGIVGMNWADVKTTSVPGSVLCGAVDQDGVKIVTGKDYGPGSVAPESQLLLLGLGSEGGEGGLKVSDGVANLMRSYNVENAGKKKAETFLVCGWRRDMTDMLRELDDVLVSGSKVTVLDEDVPEELSLGLKHVSVKCVKKRADRYENLEELLGDRSKPYDHVVLLGSAIGENEGTSSLGREEDTKTLASLVYVNELLDKQRAASGSQKDNPTMVTVEFINERVAGLAKEQRNLANAILPQNISAKIAAQTVRDSRLNAVWSELLSQRGKEVYLRSIEQCELGEKKTMSFVSVAEKIGERGDIVMGYVDRDGRVVLNPGGADKFGSRVWQDKDLLIVLAE